MPEILAAPQNRLKNNQPVDILIVDIYDLGAKAYLNKHSEGLRRQGHEVSYTSFKDRSLYASSKQHQELLRKEPRGAYPGLGTAHSYNAISNFLRGYHNVSKSDSGRKFRFHVVHIPKGYHKPDGDKFYRHLLYSKSKRGSKGFREIPAYKMVDNYLKRNPNIKAIFTPTTPTGDRVEEGWKDGLNELASKDGRRIMVVASGGNEEKSFSARSNTVGYQDFELSDSSYKHFTLIATKKDRLLKKFNFTEKNAPQISYEPKHFKGTSYTGPEIGGWIIRMLDDAILNNSLNGNTLFPAMVVDSLIDGRMARIEEGENFTIHGKEQFLGLLKTTLDGIIQRQDQSPQNSDNLLNQNMESLGGINGGR